MKINIVWRTALVLLALTLAATSLTLTNAKYITKDTASDTYVVFQIVAHTQSCSNLPAGKWAFYCKGDNGQTVGNRAGGLGAVTKGIYTIAAGESFTMGTITGGAKRGDGNGGDGGAGRYILHNLSTYPTGYGNNGDANNAQKQASLVGIVAVAGGGGGGGGDHAHNYGGNAGGYSGPTTGAGGGTLDGPWSSETGIAGAWTAGSCNATGFAWLTHSAAAGTQTSNKHNAGGGGGDGRQWNWWNAGRAGTNDTNGGAGEDGGWFYAGRGRNGGSYSTGGGGGGILGGGGGGERLMAVAGGAGGGGGGASYVCSDTSKCSATSAAPTNDYAKAAMAYFNAEAGKTNFLVVWLGPA